MKSPAVRASRQSLSRVAPKKRERRTGWPTSVTCLVTPQQLLTISSFPKSKSLRVLTSQLNRSLRTNSIVSEHVRDAESLLHALETSASLVGLHCNDKKTEYITSSSEPSSITSIHGKNIKRVDDFKYLGSFIMDSYKDFKIRKALAWQACNALGKIWRSNLDNNLKVRLFRAAVEPILLYGAETWTLTLKQQQRLDGTYTNLLRRVQNIHWSSHATLREIYRELPPISARLAKRRLLFAGHCCRAEGEAVSRLLLWSPSHLPVRSRRLTFPKVISRDAGLDVEDLRAAMCDREVWQDFVWRISAEAEG